MIVIVAGGTSWHIPTAVFLVVFGIIGVGILIGALYSFVPPVREFIRSVKW